MASYNGEAYLLFLRKDVLRLVWLIAMIVLLAVLLLSVAVFFSFRVLNIKRFTYEETYDMELQAGRIDRELFERLPKEEVFIPSPYGYKLHGLFIPAEGSNRTVIIVHGVTISLMGSVKYMDLFRKRGYNVLLYDHRRHGRSGGNTTTYGLYEKYDLKACVDWVLERCGSDCLIGIAGESMGAATALQHAAIDHRAAFYVADCPYSDLWEQLRYRLKVEYGLPPFPLLHLTSFVCWLRCGLRFGSVSPIRDIRNVRTPIFFVHGQDDLYVPTEMSVEMHRVKPGMKKLYLAPNAKHAEAYWNNREEYDRLVGEFLQEATGE